MLILLSLALAEDPPATPKTEESGTSVGGAAPASVGGPAPTAVGGSAEPAPAPPPPPAPPPEAAPPAPPAPPVAAEEPEEEAPFFTFGGELDVNARYLWRGLGVTTGPTLNPSVWGALDFGLEFGAWVAFAPSPVDLEQYPFEVDPYILYGFELGPVALEPQLTAYIVPGAVSIDGILDISVPIAGPIGLFVRPAMLLNEPPGALYTEGGLTLGAEFDNGLALEGAAGVAYALAGFNDYNFGVAASALNTVQGNVALTWYMNDHAFVRPHLEAAYVLDEAIAKATGEPFLWNGGMAAGYDF